MGVCGERDRGRRRKHVALVPKQHLKKATIWTRILKPLCVSKNMAGTEDKAAMTSLWSACE